MDDPVGQIMDILKNFEQYSVLIEKNYQTLISNHTWQKRWELIQSIILERTNLEIKEI
jgi:hypothetical protein